MHRIAILGGTGRTGRGLALRLARAGHEVSIGSRDPERARQIADEIGARAQSQIGSGTNAAIAANGDVIFAAIPFAGQDILLRDVADAVAGKILVSVAVPVEFSEGIPQAVAVPEGSAAQQAALLVPEARVVGGFHTVSSGHLSGSKELDEDVLLCGDDAEAKEIVTGIVSSIGGLRAIDAGPLHNSRITEELAVLLLEINRRRHTTAGIRITAAG